MLVDALEASVNVAVVPCEVGHKVEEHMLCYCW